MLLERKIFINNLNINNFKFEKKNNDFLYIIEIKNNIYYLKRILKDKEVIIIKIFNNQVEFNTIRNNKLIKLNAVEKNIISNDIINTLNCNILLDFINFEKLTKIINNSFINIDYSNDILGLSIVNNNLINVVLIETNSIIGYIKLDYDVKINVDEKYLKDSLNLLSNYVNSKKNKRLVLE